MKDLQLERILADPRLAKEILERHGAPASEGLPPFGGTNVKRAAELIEPRGSMPFWDLLRHKVALLPS